MALVMGLVIAAAAAAAGWSSVHAVKPFVQQAKLTGRGEVGAAWVFTRSGSKWLQQGSKLTARGEIGPAGFGYGVALSAAGDTALVGGAEDNDVAGAVWVFTRR